MKDDVVDAVPELDPRYPQRYLLAAGALISGTITIGSDFSIGHSGTPFPETEEEGSGVDSIHKDHPTR